MVGRLCQRVSRYQKKLEIDEKRNVPKVKISRRTIGLAQDLLIYFTTNLDECGEIAADSLSVELEGYAHAFTTCPFLRSIHLTRHPT